MTMMRGSILAVLYASLVASAQGETPADHGSSRLMVHIPKSLYREEGYDHQEALFGFPAYGGSIIQNVYYTDSSLCDSDLDLSSVYPRRDEPRNSPFILMVDRGDCSFVRKVRRAQHAGAAGVIVADDSCLCSDKSCTSDKRCEFEEPIMADDGSGGDISIPSFLMFKTEADAIKEQLKKDVPVQMEMTWSLPNSDDRVEYDIWATAIEDVSSDFIHQFKKFAVALGDRSYFTPHWFLYDGEAAGCRTPSGEDNCYNLCTNNGRYCSTDPDEDFDSGISGADIVKESLRRICIWNHHGDSDGVGEVWWDYIAAFMETCNTPETFMKDECVKEVYKRANVDENIVADCMSNSGGLEEGVNSLLEYELKARDSYGVVVLPTAFVNGVPIRGQLSASHMFSAICAGYADGTAPEVCGCTTCSDVNSCVSTGGVCQADVAPSKPSSRRGISVRTFVFWMLFVMASFGGLAVWQYQRHRDAMREQVRGILAEYMPLDDQNDVITAPAMEPKGGEPI